MKKLILSLIAVTTMFTAQAQVTSATPQDPKVVMSKLEKLKTIVKDEKKATKAANWLKLGDMLSEAYYINIKAIFIGATAETIVGTMGAPTNAESIPYVKFGDKEYLKYEYEKVDVYFNADNTVAFYDEKDVFYPNALEEMEVAYINTINLDPKLKEETTVKLNNIVNCYLLTMQNHLLQLDYAGAITYADKAAQLQSKPEVNDPNLMESYYYASACAMRSEDYVTAKKYLNILIDANDLREGESIYFLAFAEDKLNNTDEAKAQYEKGISMFPENQEILKGLIDIYVRTGEEPSKIIPFIKQGQEADPNNAVLYIIEGVAYENLKQIDKSIEAYKVAIKLDDSSFAAHYNLGYSYTLLADELVEEINAMVAANNPKYTEKRKELDAMKEQALPYLERAYEINNEDFNNITLLKSIYFSLRDNSPEMMEKFQKFNAIYNSMR